MGRCCPWLGVEQVELNLFGLVPRQAHDRIVPLPSKARKYPLAIALHPVIVLDGLKCNQDVPASPTIVTDGFKILRSIHRYKDMTALQPMRPTAKGPSSAARFLNGSR